MNQTTTRKMERICDCVDSAKNQKEEDESKTKRKMERICDCVDSAKNQKEDESNDEEKYGTDFAIVLIQQRIRKKMNQTEKNGTDL
jgi:hypothetical protein